MLQSRRELLVTNHLVSRQILLLYIHVAQAVHIGMLQCFHAILIRIRNTSGVLARHFTAEARRILNWTYFGHFDLLLWARSNVRKRLIHTLKHIVSTMLHSLRREVLPIPLIS